MLRNLFLTALTSLLILGNAFASAPTRDDKEKEVKIKTSAICGMCKARIERNLAFEKGVKESDLDVKTKIVTIKYNPAKTDVSKLKATSAKPATTPKKSLPMKLVIINCQAAAKKVAEWTISKPEILP